MSIITNEFLKSYSERIQEKKEEHDEEQVTFKKDLKEAGVKSFKVEYSGQGDSGEIVSTEVEPSGISISNCEWDDFNYETLSSDEKSGDRDAEGYVEDFCYDLLESYHSGWEINEGQNGYISWDNVSNALKHNYWVPVYEKHEEEF